MIGVDVEEGAAEYANLLLRPLATNLVSLELEMEPLSRAMTTSTCTAQTALTTEEPPCLPLGNCLN